jgi:hypothetical protein
MKRGRPIGSSIRQNMIEIMHYAGSISGYDLYKIYREIFPKITLRVIYYHLKKGVSLGEFILDRVEKEKGEFSWGGEVEKRYYKLGSKAKPILDERVKLYFDKKKA